MLRCQWGGPKGGYVWDKAVLVNGDESDVITVAHMRWLGLQVTQQLEVLAKSFLVSIQSRPSINDVVNNPAQRRKPRPQATEIARARRTKQVRKRRITTRTPNLIAPSPLPF
jgi:hypothetical protein